MLIRYLFVAFFSLALSTAAQVASPTHAVGGDFNGDGRGDIAVASSNGRLFLVLGDQGDGPEAPQVYLVPGPPDHLIVGDFTGDGLDDLLCSTGTALALLSGDTGNGLSQPLVLEPRFQQIMSLTSGDFNADGKLDLALAVLPPRSLTVLTGQGEGRFSEPVTVELPADPFSVVALDLNADGVDEIAVSMVGHHRVVHAVLSEGRLLTEGRLIFDEPVGYLSSGDFDGDGKDDLGATGNHKFWILARERGRLAPPYAVSAGCDALLQFLESGDLDGDGTDELVSTDLRQGRIVVPSGRLIDDGVFAWRAGLADLDGDGKAEILVANVRHGTIAVIRDALGEPTRRVYNVDPNRE